MAFTHVVTFKWRDEDYDDRGIADALRGLVARFDGVRSYLCGSDVGLTPDAYDFAVVGIGFFWLGMIGLSKFALRIASSPNVSDQTRAEDGR